MTKVELEAKHAAELAELDAKERIKAELMQVLPTLDSEKVSIYVHSGEPHAGALLWGDFHTDRTLADALAAVRAFADGIVHGEHWEDGCVNTWPRELNTAAKRGKADGSHAVELLVKGGRGFGPYYSVQFWVRAGGVLCELECPVSGLWKLLPRISGQYDRDGYFNGKVEWPSWKGCDRFRKWWSEPPAYRGSFYWAEAKGFCSWAEGELHPVSTLAAPCL